MNLMVRYTTEDPNDLIQQLKELTKRVENLESGNRIGATSIDSGTFLVSSGQMVVGGTGTPEIVFFGLITYGGEPAPGWIFRRGDGTAAYALLGTSPTEQFWALYDNQENIIFSDDGVTNQGIGRPFLPIFFTEHSNTLPVLTTTSGTFTAVQTGRYQKQHPNVQVDVLVRSSGGGTTGEVRLWNATRSELVAGPNTITDGLYGLSTLGPAPVNGAHLDTMELEIQIRRTAGAGTIGARTFLAYGKES
jgi:hypothetical protein